MTQNRTSCVKHLLQRTTAQQRRVDEQQTCTLSGASLLTVVASLTAAVPPTQVQFSNPRPSERTDHAQRPRVLFILTLNRIAGPQAVCDDCRITTQHMSLYVSTWCWRMGRGRPDTGQHSKEPARTHQERSSDARDTPVCYTILRVFVVARIMSTDSTKLSALVWRRWRQPYTSLSPPRLGCHV